jgi:hypothetical protein
VVRSRHHVSDWCVLKAKARLSVVSGHRTPLRVRPASTRRPTAKPAQLCSHRLARRPWTSAVGPATAPRPDIAWSNRAPVAHSVKQDEAGVWREASDGGSAVASCGFGWAWSGHESSVSKSARIWKPGGAGSNPVRCTDDTSSEQGPAELSRRRTHPDVSGDPLWPKVYRPWRCCRRNGLALSLRRTGTSATPFETKGGERRAHVC